MKEKFLEELFSTGIEVIVWLSRSQIKCQEECNDVKLAMEGQGGRWGLQRHSTPMTRKVNRKLGGSGIFLRK